MIVVVLSCTTTILMNTAAGVGNVDERLMRVARSFGASDWQAIRTVVIPHVVPFFMTGLRTMYASVPIITGLGMLHLGA